MHSSALERLQRGADECIFVDNSVRNLHAAQNLRIHIVLFNRDNDVYSWNVVNSFEELEEMKKHHAKTYSTCCRQAL